MMDLCVAFKILLDLIDWVSKKQAVIETSVFGAKFVAMKHGIEKLRGLRYKFCMMGILTGPSFIYGNNKSQLTNSTKPESTLKKKCTTLSATIQFKNLLPWVNP